MTTTPLPPPTEALRQLRDVIPFRLRLAFNSGEIEEGNLRVVRDSAERAASEIEWHYKAHTQARADLEAENQRLREALMLALKVMEGFDRFRRMMTDGPDASDKLLAEDYAEVAFLQAVEAIDRARAALESKP